MLIRPGVKQNKTNERDLGEAAAVVTLDSQAADPL